MLKAKIIALKPKVLVDIDEEREGELRYVISRYTSPSVYNFEEKKILRYEIGRFSLG